MNRPIPSKSAANIARKSEESQQLAPETNDLEYAQKLKLAQHLHDQGINPERWVEAEPAGWATQKAFRETGRKPDDRHFEMGGRLYKTTPVVAATQAQGQDALDVYLGAVAKPVEQLVDVTKVPLQHPLGRPHALRQDSGDAHALNLHYAKFGIDPAKAHDGDPLPMPTQQRLQQVIKAADGSDIPLGIPGIYRGYDDGYFYAANEGTAESPETQQLRRDLATAKAERLGDAAPIAANDNDPEIDEAVARSYAGKVAAKALVQPSSIKAPGAFRLPALASAIEKKQKGEPLSKDEEALLGAINVVFNDAGVPMDLQKVDVDHLRQIAEAGQAVRQDEQPRTTAPNVATPAIMGTAAAVSPTIGVTRAAAAAIAALAGEAATGAAALSSAAIAGLVGPFLALMTSGTQTQEQEDEDLRQVAMQRAATQASNSGVQPDSSLRKLLLANYQTYISLVAKLRKGEILTEEETKLSKEINSTIDQDANEIAPADVKLERAEVATAEQPNIPGQIVNDGMAIIPSIKKWLLNLLRGNPGDGAKPDCNEVYRHCQGLCLEEWNNNNLPGVGSDSKGRLRMCIRDCMEAHGCFDY